MATYTITRVYTVSGKSSEDARTRLNASLRTDMEMHDALLRFESVRVDMPAGDDDISWRRIIRDQLLGPKPVPQPAGKKAQS